MAQQRSHVVIIGGGIMGGDIAIVFAAYGWKVDVMSPSEKTRAALPARLASGLEKLGADQARAANVATHASLDGIDWSKSNKDWENVCIIANSVVSNRQARAATKVYIKAKLNMELTEGEKRTIEKQAA